MLVGEGRVTRLLFGARSLGEIPGEQRQESEALREVRRDREGGPQVLKITYLGFAFPPRTPTIDVRDESGSFFRFWDSSFRTHIVGTIRK